MTISFTRTREQLSNAVLRKLGILQAGASATTADGDVVFEAIDLRLKEMHRLGIYWRKVDEIPLSFAVSAGVNSASATADILFPISLTVVNNSQDDPVQIVGVREYSLIPNKTEQGTPVKAVWTGGANFTFWPVPDRTTTAKLLYEKIADDSTAGAAPDVDVGMLRWLKDIIAYDVADEFGVEEQRVMRLQRDSIIAERNIRKLAVQHTDYEAVAVDDFDGKPALARRNTDYGM